MVATTCPRLQLRQHGVDLLRPSVEVACTRHGDWLLAQANRDLRSISLVSSACHWAFPSCHWGLRLGPLGFASQACRLASLHGLMGFVCHWALPSSRLG